MATERSSQRIFDSGSRAFKLTGGTIKYLILKSGYKIKGRKAIQNLVSAADKML
jgi:hypothetical protein